MKKIKIILKWLFAIHLGMLLMLTNLNASTINMNDEDKKQYCKLYDSQYHTYAKLAKNDTDPELKRIHLHSMKHYNQQRIDYNCPIKGSDSYGNS